MTRVEIQFPESDQWVLVGDYEDSKEAAQVAIQFLKLKGLNGCLRVIGQDALERSKR